MTDAPLPSDALSFAIGEVAIAISMHGRSTAEVVIEALPEPGWWIDKFGLWMPAGAYLISRGHEHYRCCPTQLLKRPPAHQCVIEDSTEVTA